MDPLLASQEEILLSEVSLLAKVLHLDECSLKITGCVCVCVCVDV
jgi:hypothetical protein